MTKKDAAELLGVSERAIERYTAKGLLAPRYERRAGQRLAIYDQKQVKLLRRQMQQGDAATPQQNLAVNSANQALTALPSRSLAASEQASLPAAEQFLAALSEIARASSLPVDRKLGLRIDEAAELTGLSAHFIRLAIRRGKLPATRPGRAWHIKRRDLELWHAKL